MGIVADNRRCLLAAKLEKKRIDKLWHCRCGKRLADHLEQINGKCMDCLCAKWEGIAEDALF